MAAILNFRIFAKNGKTQICFYLLNQGKMLRKIVWQPTDSWRWGARWPKEEPEIFYDELFSSRLTAAKKHVIISMLTI